MSERLTIKSNERGVIRLFTINPEEEPPHMSVEPDWEADANDPPWPLRDALGLEYLDSDFIELLDVSDLTGVGLSGYMIEGLGIAEADIAPHRAQLDTITGYVLLVFSSALGGFDAVITPKPPLRWVGTFVEEQAPVKFVPLPDEAAKGEVPGPAKAPPSDAAMSGRVATVALLVMFALVALMIWVAA